MMFATFALAICFFVAPTLGTVKHYGPGDQDFGYVNVRPKAYMFWWLFRTTAQVNSSYTEKPLVIWLQGGPGMSSTAQGNLDEIGPMTAEFYHRHHSWVNNYNVLFIDHPVGTGFSYTEGNTTEEKSALIPTTNEEAVADLLLCIKTFYEQHKSFQQTPTYVVGESWGGKVTVELAYRWAKARARGYMLGNLKGIALADPYISGVDSYTAIAPYLYNLGLIDDEGYEELTAIARDFVNATADEDWDYVRSIAIGMEFAIQNHTKHMNRYNVLTGVVPESDLNTIFIRLSNNRYSERLRRIMTDIKYTLELREDWGVQEAQVSNILLGDSRKPALKFVDKLLNETDIKILVLNGQLDPIVPTLGTLGWIKKLSWEGLEDWSNAPRLPVTVNDITEAYCRTYGKFSFCNVLRAGHQIAIDNPVALKTIIDDFISTQL